MTDRPPQLPPVHEAWLPREHSLHRPRHGGRQLIALVSAVVFFAAPALMWVFGARPGEIENRELAGFPHVSDGWSFFTGLPTWATDQLVFREGAVDAADAVSRGIFGEPAPFGQGSRDAGPIPDTPQDGTGGTGDEPDGTDGGSPTESPGEHPGYRQVVEGKDGWLYYGADIRAKCSPAQPLAETLDGISRLRNAVEASGRQFLLVVAPDKTTMVPENLPDDYAGKECAQQATTRFWDTVGNQDGFVDLRPSLDTAATQTGMPVYFDNDTHWTGAGAVALTSEIAETIRPGVTERWSADRVGWSHGRADLPAMQGRSGQKTSVRYALRPDGETDRTRPSLPRLDRPSHYTSTAGPDTINAKTLVAGDSFSLASARYLPAGFSDLTLLGFPRMSDYPQATVDAFVRSEVVVVQSAERTVANGDLPLADDEFIDRVGPAMARQPVR